MGRGIRIASILALLGAVAVMGAAPLAADEGRSAASQSVADATRISGSASLVQEESPLVVIPLASGQLGRLPNESLRWVVREFRWPAGYTSALLTHPPDVFYVLEGVTSLTHEGVTVSLGPGGAGFVKGTDYAHVHAAAGNAPARVLGFYLYPASLPTPGDSPTSVILFESAPLEGLADGPYTLALTLVEGRPGASPPTHIHTGPTLPYLLEGAIDQTLGGVSTPRRAGDAWLEQPGVVSAARFTGPTSNRLLVAQVLPQGDPILIPVD